MNLIVKDYEEINGGIIMSRITLKNPHGVKLYGFGEMVNERFIREVILEQTNLDGVFEIAELLNEVDATLDTG